MKHFASCTGCNNQTEFKLAEGEIVFQTPGGVEIGYIHKDEKHGQVHDRFIICATCHRASSLIYLYEP